jgi:hypothetical protein
LKNTDLKTGNKERLSHYHCENDYTLNVCDEILDSSKENIQRFVVTYDNLDVTSANKRFIIHNGKGMISINSMKNQIIHYYTKIGAYAPRYQINNTSKPILN